MIGFILGISITVNVVLVIAIIIYLNTRKSVDFSSLKSNINDDDFLNDELIDKDIAKDFLDNSIDFSSLIRK